MTQYLGVTMINYLNWNVRDSKFIFTKIHITLYSKFISKLMSAENVNQ